MSINTQLFASKNEAVLFACLQILDEDLAWRLLEKVHEKERWELDCSKDEFNDAVKAEYIKKQDLDINRIQEMQKYQYERRKLSGWRILPVQVLSGFILNFKGLSITKQALTAKIKVGVNNMIGTTKRIIRR